MKPEWSWSRRRFLGAAPVLAAALPRFARGADTGAPVDLGSRRELFVDGFLVERMEDAVLRLHTPEPAEVALVCDAPWEGNTSAYFAILRDGDRFRAYYRGSHFDETAKKGAHPEVTAMAESRDGRAWTKPDLGVCEFAGSRGNSIVWTGEGSHNFTPFLDANPACRPDARYKAFAGGTVSAGGKRKPCLDALASADGVRWSVTAHAVITDGAFDSQNLAFWDAHRGEYRAYWRFFDKGVRAIRTAVSRDFLRWERQADLRYEDSPAEHLYTNAVMPYARAPHLFIGFPTRYQPKTQQVEPVFMSSRDGVLFRRWGGELIPITAPKDRDGNRSNYLAWGLLELPGRPGEMSVFATEAYYKGPAGRVRRFTFRTDGFVSVAAAGRGELRTRPLRFEGRSLELNVKTAPAGRVAVELQDEAGRVVPGFAAADCVPFAGDAIAHTVTWKGRPDLAPLAGRPVRIRFILEAADLFSMKFNA